MYMCTNLYKQSKVDFKKMICLIYKSIKYNTLQATLTVYKGSSSGVDNAIAYHCWDPSSIPVMDGGCM